MDDELICPYCGMVQDCHEPDDISAEMCDSIAEGYEIDQQGESDYHDEWIAKLRYAAFLLRKIASGEYAPVVQSLRKTDC